MQCVQSQYSCWECLRARKRTIRPLTIVNVQEQDLVGLWWDEFEYSDVTEDGVPFSRVLLAVKADADHTGCIYLGVFNDESDEPLALYGGPLDAGFTWRLLSNGTIELGDPVTGERYALTRGADGSSYGNGATDVPNTSLTYNDGSVQMNNGSYSGELEKADAGKEKEIEEKLGCKKSVGLLSTAEASNIGQVVCADGKLYPAKTAVPEGCTAVGILGKVTETGHGLIISLQDATEHTWDIINGWTSVTTYAGTTLKLLPGWALGRRLTSYTTLGSTAVSNWCVAQKSDYEAIFTNLGSTKDKDGYTYDANVNAYITTGVGGTAISGSYWSATKYDGYRGWRFHSGYWSRASKGGGRSLRPVLGF